MTKNIQASSRSSKKYTVDFNSKNKINIKKHPKDHMIQHSTWQSLYFLWGHHRSLDENYIDKILRYRVSLASPAAFLFFLSFFFCLFVCFCNCLLIFFVSCGILGATIFSCQTLFFLVASWVLLYIRTTATFVLGTIIRAVVHPLCHMTPPFFLFFFRYRMLYAIK